MYYRSYRRRNLVIADIFSRMNFMERRGSGFKKINGDYKSAANYSDELAPVYYSDNSTFRITLYNLNYNVPLESGEEIAKVTEKVTERVTEKAILDILQKKPHTTYKELAEQFNVSRKTVSLKIKQLKEKGIIVRAGSDTKGVWQIVKDK